MIKYNIGWTQILVLASNAFDMHFIFFNLFKNISIENIALGLIVNILFSVPYQIINILKQRLYFVGRPIYLNVIVWFGNRSLSNQICLEVLFILFFKCIVLYCLLGNPKYLNRVNIPNDLLDIIIG